MPENRFINQILEHPGGQLPTRLDVLEDIKLIIYFHHPDEKFLDELKKFIENPEKMVHCILEDQKIGLFMMENPKRL